jgi:hypothetical protein
MGLKFPLEVLEDPNGKERKKRGQNPITKLFIFFLEVSIMTYQPFSVLAELKHISSIELGKRKPSKIE